MSGFKFNRREFGKYLRSEDIKVEMERRAKLIEARAIALAPVGRNDSTIGAADKKVKRYKDSFKVTTGIRRTGVHDPDLDYTFKSTRAYARIVNTKEYAVFVEYGTNRTVTDENGKKSKERVNAHRVLGRAIDAARG